MIDSLEELSGVASEFEGKKTKPITLGGWAFLISRLRSLFIKDAYNIDDVDIREQELIKIRSMSLDSRDVFRALGRDEIGPEYFWLSLSDNNWSKEEMRAWLVSLDAERQQVCFNHIIDISSPKKAGEVTGNP